MSDLPARDLLRDCRGGPWPSVRDVARCPACLGALPADDDGACSTCGIGTPPGLPRIPDPIAADWLAHGLDANGHEHGTVPAAEPAAPAGWMSTLRSWARWPNP